MKAIEIPDHWLRLAGEFLREDLMLRTDDEFAFPADWSEEEVTGFRDSVFEWLNTPEQHYSPDCLLNWMVIDFLGAVFRSAEPSPEPFDEFATQTLLVTP